MAVSETDKQIMRRQAAALKLIERPEDAQLTGFARAQTVRKMNERRRADGLPDLINDEEQFPELGFHRLACARGMVR